MAPNECPNYGRKEMADKRPPTQADNGAYLGRPIPGAPTTRAVCHGTRMRGLSFRNVGCSEPFISYSIYSVDFFQLRICRPPPLRSGHIYMKDAHSTE